MRNYCTHTEPLSTNYFHSHGIDSVIGNTLAGSTIYGHTVRRMTAIGERIREVRKAKKLTQKQVEAASGDPPIKHNYISKIENGHELNPQVSTLKRIAKGLGVEYDVLTQPPKSGVEVSPSDSESRKGRTETDRPDSTVRPITAHTSGTSTRPTVESLADELATLREHLVSVGELLQQAGGDLVAIGLDAKAPRDRKKTRGTGGKKREGGKGRTSDDG